MEDKLDLILSKLQEMDRRMQLAGELTKSILTRLDRIEGQNKETVQRLDLIEKQLHQSVMALLKEIDTKVDHQNRKIEVLNNRLLAVEAKTAT